MGAQAFGCLAVSMTPANAFWAVRDEALVSRGNSGYSGTIAEKTSFTLIPVHEALNVKDLIRNMVDDECLPEQFFSITDPYEDKHGPAGCFDLGLATPELLRGFGTPVIAEDAAGAWQEKLVRGVTFLSQGPPKEGSHLFFFFGIASS